MKIRLEFDHEQVRLDLGDLFELTQQMNASGPAAEWQQVLNAMQDNGVAGIEINGEEIHLTLKSGQNLSDRFSPALRRAGFANRYT